ncbi:hypothetical protein PDE_03730 [Penicillium oxalicum 114-2]|uniref:Peptidase C14 caspase domain-containing protein n=1 Tax=Penicillium oxalicum (strain 114-2 / CGMCC 5302) TaxID=933388 RepID=S7ZET4_PENO1|nr:hypothetical protein PDE_03730 [Penicillium oxalicum 114-2]
MSSSDLNVLSDRSICRWTRPQEGQDVPDLRASLQKTIEARDNQYVNIRAVLFYFEDDNTNAAQDARTFSHLLDDVFEIQWQEVCLQSSDRFPENTFKEHVKGALLPPDALCPQLLIVYYAGHGWVTEGGDFRLGTEKRFIQWTFIKNELIDTSMSHDMTGIDVLYVLDCCYGGTAKPTRGLRAIQALAASEFETNVRSRNQISFTRNLRTAIYGIKAGQQGLSIISIFERLQRPPNTPSVTPTMTTFSGLYPIVLPLKKGGRHATSSSSSSSSPQSSQTLRRHSWLSTQSPSDIHVLVDLVINGEAEEDIYSFHQTVQAFPPHMHATIVNAWRTSQQSFVVLLEMSWETWALWSMTVDLRVCRILAGQSVFSAQAPLSDFEDLSVNASPLVLREKQ